MKSHKLLTKKEPEKNLLLSLQKKAGRTNSGRITVRHRGGGVKRMYRIVDFGQEKMDIPGKVIAIEYDPYRTSFIALVLYFDGEAAKGTRLSAKDTPSLGTGMVHNDGSKRYVLAPNNLVVGNEIICAETAEVKIGNRMKLKNIPVGTQVFNIELMPGQGGKMIKSAGSAAIVAAQEGEYVQLEMPSGEVRRVFANCFATVGQVSYPEHRYEVIGKAGRRRLRGWRPTVRGTAMNPVDHPHGGGEGRSPIGMKYPKTPWGKPALGVKTRGKKWTDKMIIKRRSK